MRTREEQFTQFFLILSNTIFIIVLVILFFLHTLKLSFLKDRKPQSKAVHNHPLPIWTLGLYNNVSPLPSLPQTDITIIPTAVGDVCHLNINKVVLRDLLKRLMLPFFYALRCWKMHLCFSTYSCSDYNSFAFIRFPICVTISHWVTSSQSVNPLCKYCKAWTNTSS